MLGVKKKKGNRFKKKAGKKPLALKNRLGFAGKIIAGTALLLAISTLFVFGHDYFTQSDLFNAKTITITGLNRLTKEMVLDHARIGPGSNILAMNLRIISNRLAAHPWIHRASVQRQIPGTVHITVKEHEPLAVIDMNDNQYIVDRYGRIFKKREAKEGGELPLITGLDYTDVNVSGKPYSPSFDAVMELLKLGEKKGSAIPKTKINTIEVDREVGVAINMNSEQKQIKLGFGRYPEKLRVLKRILPKLNKNPNLKQFRTIDLNDINRIVVTPMA